MRVACRLGKVHADLSATDTLAILPFLGITGRYGRTGKHDPMRGQQLFHPGLLAELAQELQLMGRPVRIIFDTLSILFTI